MATHSSVLAWRVPGTGEPGGLLSLGSHRAGHDWSNLAAAALGNSLVAQMGKNLLAMWETWIQSLDWEDPWRRAWQPTPVFLPGEFHRQRSLVGYMGSERVGDDRVTFTATQLWQRWIMVRDEVGIFYLVRVLDLFWFFVLFWLVLPPFDKIFKEYERLYVKVVKVLVIQSCPILCDPMDCSPSGSSVHRILQARILEWAAIPFQGIFPTQGSNQG